jgi:hypothetical protein
MNNKKIFFIFGAVAIIIVIIAVLMRDDDADDRTDVDVNVERENRENNGDDGDDDDDDQPVDPMNGGTSKPGDTIPAEPKPADTAKPGAAKPDPAGSASVRRIVEESVPSGLISAAAMNGDAVQVVLNPKSADPAMASYFKEGDRLDRLYAIDLPHWFTKLPAANRIVVDLKMPDGTFTFNVTRKQTEEFFGMKLNSDMANPDRWRDEFLDRHDNPQTMLRFVNKYIKAPPGAK